MIKAYLSDLQERGLVDFLAKQTFRHSSDSRISFYEVLADYMSAGIDIQGSIEAFLEQAEKEGKGENNLEVVRLNAWVSSLSEGDSFEESLYGWIPERERMLLSAYEKSGSLASGLLKAVQMIERSGEMKSIWVGALAYPGFLILLAGGVVHLYGTDVLPKFTAILPPEKWPSGPANLQALADMIVNNWPIMLASMPVFFAAFVFLLPRWTGPLRNVLDRFIPFSFYKQDEGAAFMVSLTAMLEAGTPVMKAVEQLNKNASPWLNERLEPVLQKMKAGKNIAAALQEAGHDFPDKKLLSLMALHADKKTFTESLPKQVDRWIARTIVSMRKKGVFLNLMAMGGVAGLAAWIYLAIGDLSAIVGSSAGMR